MGRKIVLLFEIHPVITYARRYDFKSLLNAGYVVDICDLANLCSMDYGGKSTIEESIGIKNYSFEGKKEFKKYIDSQEKDTFIWSTFQLTAEYFWVFKTISKYRYGFICNVDYVMPRSTSRILKKRYWTKWSWSRIKNAILRRCPQSLLPVRKADAVITYGEGDVQRKLDNVLYDEHTVVELTNTIDYNECINALSLNGNEEIKDLPEKYVLFIDEYIPYHSEGLKRGMRVDASKYYREVETFLQRVSKIMGLPIIVAAHPIANYSLHLECYQGMRIIQFQTAELILKAKLVITHLSTVVGMILVCNKPYLLITTHDLERIIYGELTEPAEYDLKCKVINVSMGLTDDEIKKEMNESFNRNKAYYETQILKYRLPKGHPNESLSFGEIMIKAMKRVEIGEKA